jgi:hypothetical protein
MLMIVRAEGGGLRAEEGRLAAPLPTSRLQGGEPGLRERHSVPQRAARGLGHAQRAAC